MIQAGDFVKGNGRKFENKKIIAKHIQPDLLSVINTGHNNNESYFYLTCAKYEWLEPLLEEGKQHRLSIN